MTVMANLPTGAYCYTVPGCHGHKVFYGSLFSCVLNVCSYEFIGFKPRIFHGYDMIYGLGVASRVTFSRLDRYGQYLTFTSTEIGPMHGFLTENVDMKIVSADHFDQTRMIGPRSYLLYFDWRKSHDEEPTVVDWGHDGF